MGSVAICVEYLTQQDTARDNLRLLAYMLGTALFFVVTLLISFFLVIVMINRTQVPANIAPNLFMVGLVPPSILTIIVFIKVLGKFSVSGGGGK